MKIEKILENDEREKKRNSEQTNLSAFAALSNPTKSTNGYTMHLYSLVSETRFPFLFRDDEKLLQEDRNTEKDSTTLRNLTRILRLVQIDSHICTFRGKIIVNVKNNLYEMIT